MPARDPRDSRPAPLAPDRSIGSADGLHRVDLFLSGRSEVGARGQAIPLYHVVLVRVRDGRVIADTRKTRHEAWFPGVDGMRLELSIPGDSERFIAIDLRDSTCGEENFRGPIGPDVGLADLQTLLC